MKTAFCRFAEIPPSNCRKLLNNFIQLRDREMRLFLSLALALTLSACARPHDDGMGDLWKGVKLQQERKL